MQERVDFARVEKLPWIARSVDDPTDVLLGWDRARRLAMMMLTITCCASPAHGRPQLLLTVLQIDNAARIELRATSSSNSQGALRPT